jgi:hypothetical protein
MAEAEKPSLHVDTDWKKQAQEEKRRLAEQQQKAAATPPPPRVPPPGVGLGPAGAAMGAPVAAPGGLPGTPGATGARARRERPEASFASLVQSLMTQTLFYLGELAPAGGEPMLNLDMAKHQLDTLSVLEEKTANNLTEDEKRLLDAALYDTRARFIAVAQQFIG